MTETGLNPEQILLGRQGIAGSGVRSLFFFLLQDLSFVDNNKKNRRYRSCVGNLPRFHPLTGTFSEIIRISA